MNLPQWFYTTAWVLILVQFCIVEWIALKDPDLGDTLSEHVWNLTSFGVTWFVFAGFMLWLTIHFLTKGWV